MTAVKTTALAWNHGVVSAQPLGATRNADAERTEIVL